VCSPHPAANGNKRLFPMAEAVRNKSNVAKPSANWSMKTLDQPLKTRQPNQPRPGRPLHKAVRASPTMHPTHQ
jgi:hypothetical protein